MPQGTKLGPWLFLIMIDDLAISNGSLWKYVDNTKTSEVIRKGQLSNAQTIAGEVADWSNRNRVKLNTDKCKELRISFALVSHDFPPVVIGGECIKVVTDAKLLDVTSDLSWNVHVTEVIKKQLRGSIFSSSLKEPVFLRKIFVFFTSHVCAPLSIMLYLCFYMLCLPT